MVWWDWSEAGDKDRKVQKDEYGKPLYDLKKGVFEWKKQVRPSYAWFNGYMERVLVGDKVDFAGKIVDPDAPKEVKKRGDYVHLNYPVGSKKDPDSKITPFKIMRGVQPVDPKNRLILVPHLFPYDEKDETAYWKNLDWQKALEEGTKAMELPYSGEYAWARTDMYWQIEHEVVPEELALSCRQCHVSLTGKKTCDRCHQKGRSVNFSKLMEEKDAFERMRELGWESGELKDRTDYINFEKLGYEGDPIIYGGRFKRLPLVNH
jgi:hypothetical protein